MKKSLSILLFAAVMISCGSGDSEVTTDLINNPNSANSEAGSDAMPKLKFEEDAFDFGDISQGEKVKHAFKFKNTGNANLIISSAIGSCGCTVPSYPKEPIAPGESGEVMVEFNSAGKQGAQHKRVNIVANTNPNKTIIAIMANVMVPKGGNKNPNGPIEIGPDKE